MKKFEYFVVDNADQDDLDRMGQDYWELVSVVRADVGLRFYFKREIS